MKCLSERYAVIFRVKTPGKQMSSLLMKNSKRSFREKENAFFKKHDFNQFNVKRTKYMIT